MMVSYIWWSFKISSMFAIMCYLLYMFANLRLAWLWCTMTHHISNVFIISNAFSIPIARMMIETIQSSRHTIIKGSKIWLANIDKFWHLLLCKGHSQSFLTHSQGLQWNFGLKSRSIIMNFTLRRSFGEW